MAKWPAQSFPLALLLECMPSVEAGWETSPGKAQMLCWLPHAQGLGKAQHNGNTQCFPSRNTTSSACSSPEAQLAQCLLSPPPTKITACLTSTYKDWRLKIPHAEELWYANKEHTGSLIRYMILYHLCPGETTSLNYLIQMAFFFFFLTQASRTGYEHREMESGLRTNSHWFQETTEEAEEIPTAENECNVCSNLKHQRSNPEDNHGNIPIKEKQWLHFIRYPGIQPRSKNHRKSSFTSPSTHIFPSFFRKRTLTKTQPWYQHQWGPIHPLKQNKTTKGRFRSTVCGTARTHTPTLPIKVLFPKTQTYKVVQL